MIEQVGALCGDLIRALGDGGDHRLDGFFAELRGFFENLANRSFRIVGEHREGTINCLVFRDVDLGEPLAVHVLKQVVLWADVRVEFVGVDAWLHAHSFILNRSPDNRPSRLQTG